MDGTWRYLLRESSSEKYRAECRNNLPAPVITEGREDSKILDDEHSWVSEKVCFTPFISTAELIRIALIKEALGENALFRFLRPLGKNPSMKYCRTKAAAPETRGTACEVPPKYLRFEIAASFEHEGLPESLEADAMYIPGAMMSGLSLPSSAGPWEEK
jgi:hypothetical protein